MGDLPKEKVIYFADWCKRWLVALSWDWKIEGTDIIWHLKEVSKCHYQNLLFLTAFRMVDEFKNNVRWMWEHKGDAKTTEDHFQLCWRSYAANRCGSGHDLIYISNYGSGMVPITVAQFAITQYKTLCSMYSYWNPKNAVPDAALKPAPAAAAPAFVAKPA